MLDLPWRERAICKDSDPDAWYPTESSGYPDAERLCDPCPVKAECLQYALENDEQEGVWGGLRPRRRNKLRRASAA